MKRSFFVTCLGFVLINSLDATHNFSRGADVTVTNQLFSKLIPASCVFTLVGM